MQQQGIPTGGMPQPNQQAQQQAEQQKQAEAKRDMLLTQIMTSEAKERLNRIKLVKPDQANKITDKILQMAGNGSITSKVTEGRLKDIMNTLLANAPKTKITILRKPIDSDSDEDYMNDI